jgi:hypothetical protein
MSSGDEEKMGFDRALRLLRYGNRLRRRAWSLTTVEGVEWVESFVPVSTLVREDRGGFGVDRAATIANTPHGRLMGPRKGGGAIRDWVPTHADLMADDWEAINGELL